MKGLILLKGGDNWKIVKIHLELLKIFSRTTGLFSTKLGTKHPWVNMIHFYFIFSNEGSRPFQGVDNCKIEKWHKASDLIFFI